MAYEWINHLLIGMHIQSPKPIWRLNRRANHLLLGTRQSRQRTLPILFENRQGPNPNQDGLNQLTFIW